MTENSTETAEESRDTGAGRHRGQAAPVEEPASSAPHGRHRREEERRTVSAGA
ncbi:hypothetical protein ACIQRS_28540 [Streptomyces termitum]|uniref:Uncharacterized protein n=1 Tax=Streptomyces termitum TaxID=67368 RepID=A0A918TBH8_9ACTN|nr:hypothetical protein [Streptomyces termitum]GHB03959.1 hypothetical protein GCM10010305_53870 [Streptomyces termitum]